MRFLSQMDVFGLLAFIAGTGFIVTTINVLSKLIIHRKQMFRLQAQGLPVAAFNWILGSAIGVGKLMVKLPEDAHLLYLPRLIRLAYPSLGPVYYIDNWPFSTPILVAGSPATAYQTTQENSLPKFPTLRKFLRPMTGGYDLLSLEGSVWKEWRAKLNPGFSSANLLSLVPQILSEVSIFCDLLQKQAQNQEMVKLKHLTDNLTVDIIGYMVLNKSFEAQVSEHKAVTALRKKVPWLSSGGEFNLWRRWHPARPWIHWTNTRILDQYISEEVDSRWAGFKAELGESNCKSIIDLAFRDYWRSRGSQSDKLDYEFKTMLVGQIKSFLFSGHDTTSTTLCYVFYLLSSHPYVARRLGEEHAEVFGPSASAASSSLAADPQLLNQVPYTTAVIKETMRLFPIASTTREGRMDLSLSSESGAKFPTMNYIVWPSHHAIQRDSLYWPSPDDFIPERWLAPEHDKLHPIKGAYRPFEFGPRNCVGQELAMLEMKIVLIMMVRKFRLVSCYEEWDSKFPRSGPTTVLGERAYLTADGAPSDGMPCRVELF